jgi:hypothetical protein
MHSISGVTYDGDAQYTYLRIRQADRDRAWTAPVWLEPSTPASTNDEVISVSLTVTKEAETATITKHRRRCR